MEKVGHWECAFEDHIYLQTFSIPLWPATAVKTQLYSCVPAPWNSPPSTPTGIDPTNPGLKCETISQIKASFLLSAFSGASQSHAKSLTHLYFWNLSGGLYDYLHSYLQESALSSLIMESIFSNLPTCQILFITPKSIFPGSCVNMGRYTVREKIE